MCGDEYDVRSEGAALAALMKMNPLTRARVWRAFQELRIDPHPRHLEQATDFLSLRVVEKLRAEGYDIHRLRTRLLGNLRIFYFIFEPDHRVLVKEIVKRDSRTYELEAPHIQRLMENYEKWGSLATGRELPC